MIDVKSAEPKIFITCDIYREKDLCEDVLNIVFSYSIKAKCIWFYGKGFSVVFLEDVVDVYKVIKYLVSRYIRGYWVLPIDRVCVSSYEDIVRCTIDVILLKYSSLPLSVIGLCRKRGGYIDSCSNLLRYVGEAIENLGIAIIDFKHYEYVLRIEVVYDKTFLSIYRKCDEPMFRIARTSNKSIH